MTKKFHDHMTPKRLEWLEKLSVGPAVRGKTPTAFYCMQLGWTQWLPSDRGSRLEVLTDLGRKKLALAKTNTLPIPKDAP